MLQHPRTAFSRACFEQLDSMVRHGRFNGVSVEERLCICGASATEDIGHLLVDGKLYSPERAAYVDPYLKTKKYF